MSSIDSTRISRLKAGVQSAIEQSRDEIISFGEDIFEHPELGFRELRTADRLGNVLGDLGMDVVDGLAISGIKADVRGGAAGPAICVMGELDALPLPSHPRSDPVTGAAHACGHHAQLAHLVGVAHGLAESGAMQHLAGRVVYVGVPAEEYVDLDWRREQQSEGRLEFLGGKAELLRVGTFDDVDIAMMVHATGREEDRSLALRSGMNGMLAKRVRFLGREAHAGTSPERGINALNAATLAIQAIHAQRETFRDDDRIRVHPIMTSGGETVNVVPAEARLEMYVRAATTDALTAVAGKVDRALRAGALALGATVEIETLPGYLPLHPYGPLDDVFARNAQTLVGDDLVELGPTGGSTDAGDLSHLMPVLHPFHGGCGGSNHSPDFAVTDPETAYVMPAIAMAWTIVDLLTANAAEAREISASFVPDFTIEGYIEHMRQLSGRECYDA